MNTAVINVKTEPEVKHEAQILAKKFGVSLSSLVNAYLKQLVRTKKIEFTLEEKPTTHLLSILNLAQEDIKTGKVSPRFKNADDASKWLNS
ncbi:type II toxin-antitoxin system RelB/DinJ family antitoxin [Patescibacteria group bacterium]|nr:type II toxin-antitoxin system RelB/DinJ family antitoxin [Patescibacteria group bacterium]